MILLSMRTVLDELRDKGAAVLTAERKVRYIHNDLVRGSIRIDRLHSLEDQLVSKVEKIANEVDVIS